MRDNNANADANAIQSSFKDPCKAFLISHTMELGELNSSNPMS